MIERAQSSELVGAFRLYDAVALAIEAHAGQEDKGTGQPYNTHPLRVSLALEPYGEAAQIGGVLHDVVEDTWVSFNYLRAQGLDEEIINDIDGVTKRDGEPYKILISRAVSRPGSRLIKLADNLDNSNEKRLINFRKRKAEEFRCKYAAARQELLKNSPWLEEQAAYLGRVIDEMQGWSPGQYAAALARIDS